jgi:hypothetical protein
MRLRKLVALAPFLFSIAACNPAEISQDTACVDWPNDVCPSEREAPFYLDFQEPGDCGTSLVSIDGPAVVKEKQCCWPVTESYQPCSEQAF